MYSGGIAYGPGPPYTEAATAQAAGAFLHQTFQEYLAARHLWLKRPRSQAVERVLEVAGDPRWHEVVRLTAGFVGVIQEDDEMVTELVQAIAGDPRHPLEPHLCGSLRLAASCIADDVRVSPRVAGAVVSRICERLSAQPHALLRNNLVEVLRSMRTYRPDEQAVVALLGLKDHGAWAVRQEAARLLSRVADQNTLATEGLQEFFNDKDSDVRAHAAVGLWRAKRGKPSVVKAILYGLTSRKAKMAPFGGLGLIPHVLEFLESEDASVRYRAASVLGNWCALEASGIRVQGYSGLGGRVHEPLETER